MKRDKDGPKLRCTGKKADGRPCMATPLAGTTRCWHHSFKVPGRPTKLTPALVEMLLDAILEGAYIETAAQAVGINKTTFYRWLRKAEELEAVAMEQLTEEQLDEAAEAAVYDVTDPDVWVYLDFRHAVKSAEAFAEIELLRRVTRPGAVPWQASMTVLERRFPERWARRDKVQHEGAIDLGRPRVVVLEDDERRRELAQILSDADALRREDDVA